MTNKRKHYLYSTWYWLHTQQKSHQVEPEWSNLDLFIEELGDRPTDKHRLHRIDPSLGYIRGNVVWRLMLKHDPTAKSWCQRNPDKVRSHKIKHRFGLSTESYEILLKKQNHCCAICGVHENDYHQKLSIDHCHITGKIRGLLCSDCNFMLGRAKDNISTLQNGITYLQGLSL